ncbi:MAG: YceI family protein [Acidobacteria bacterium]|nr:YceI family protein [Acidobacteriota bacterium]MCA1641148.1 YceI family protein [Acidobacteriota bacterium]
MRTLRLTLLALLAFNASVTRPTAAPRPTADAPAARFLIDAARSDFLVRAFAGGALWFKGHDHFVRPREFSGEVTLTPGAITPASLTMRVRADSLAETRDVFTEPQKQIINKELREIVVEPDKYPEIIFRSTAVRVDAPAGGEFGVRIEGDLTLHGVTRRVEIPARVTMEGGDLRARGEFHVSRKDFNVKATSAFHGTVRVRDRLKVVFNIVARQG